MAGIYKTPKIYKSDAVGGIYNDGSKELSYVIGGRRYKCVKIGDQIWMAENLDFKFDGLIINPSSSTSPSASYYDNNETTYGIDGARKCGLLYNWYAVKYLEDNKVTLIPGWHVPTSEEWTALTESIGENPGTKLKALNNSVDSGTWPTGWGGTDDYGFGVLPAGRGGYDGFRDIGSSGTLWSSYNDSSSSAQCLYFNTGSSVIIYSYGLTREFSVRLVKD